MNGKQVPADPLPDSFSSLEEAAEFWEGHDTTHYLDDFETVQVDAKLERRRFQVELDADLMEALAGQARARGVGVHSLVSEWLREKVRPAA